MEAHNRYRRDEPLRRGHAVTNIGVRGVSLLPTLADPRRKERSIQNIQPTDSSAVQLIEAAGLRDACDLDLLLFFSRHPRVVLSSEQLATYVGYDLQQIAGALDRLLGARLLTRALNRGAPGRMYVLEADHSEEWLEPLRRMCAKPDGRNALKALLKQRQSQNGGPDHRRLSGGRPS
jgi:hypothetical protein